MWSTQPLHNTRGGQYNKCMQLIPHGTSHVPSCHTMEGSKPWYLCFCVRHSNRAAHLGKWGLSLEWARLGREQVASEQATCRGYYSCCTVLLLYCSFHYYIMNLLCLDFWVLGWPYFSKGWAFFQVEWAYFWMVWAYFRERGFSKIRPPPSLSSHLSSLPMGVFREPMVFELTLCSYLT